MIPNLIKNYCRFTQNFSSHFQNSCLCGMPCTKSLPIMLALCSMPLPSYYAPNYAGIIGSGLIGSFKLVGLLKKAIYLVLKHLLEKSLFFLFASILYNPYVVLDLLETANYSPNHLPLLLLLLLSILPVRHWKPGFTRRQSL